MNIYIISGANGFLGNNIIRKLQCKDNIEIRAIVVPNHNIESLDGLKCKIYYASVENYDSLNETFKINENDNVVVIHCAAKVYIGNKYRQDVFDVNVNGTKNMLEHSLRCNAKFVYISSSSVFVRKNKYEKINENSLIDIRKTKSLYEKTKILGEQLVNKYKEKGLKTLIVYPSSIFGSNDYKDTYVERMIIELSKGHLNYSIKGSYDFVDVNDVAKAIIKLADNNKFDSKYIISNQEVKVTDLLNICCKKINRKEIHFSCPSFMAKIVAPIYKALTPNKELANLFNNESIKVLHYGANLDNEKLIKEIGFKPTDLEKSLDNTIHFLKIRNKI